MRPGGLKTTGAFRAKALLLYLRDRLGRETSRRFVELIGGRGIFDDETRPISQTLWLRALREFARLAGSKAVTEIGPYLVHPENLGAWSRLLRGATHPSQVFEQLGLVSEGLPGDSLWVSSDATAQGCVCLADPPTPEERGDRELVLAALQAELEAVPYLLGLPRAKVKWTDTPDVGVTFTVRWRQPGERWLLGAVLVTAGWSVFAAVCVALRQTFWQEWIPRGRDYLVFAVPFPASIFLWLARRDALRHAETRMQRMRILALEREAVLRQTRHKEISRPHEEPIIAGQYRVGTQLGVGATGAVWEATRLTDNTQVAIKLLRTAVVHDVRASDRLRREAEALGLSWHPNVVEVFDSGLLPSGVGFLVMERLYGETLAERLERLGPLPRPLVKKLALEAVDALFAIHSAGVVHRDIKPGNLFVEKAEDEVRLKIIDFGVAQVSWAETRLTRSGVRIGTVGYASPEQEDGSDVDGRSDLYGLGIVLYECLTGKGPRSDAPLTAEALSLLPEDWARFLDRLVRVDRSERYASAREAREALLAVKSVAPPPPADEVDSEGVA